MAFDGRAQLRSMIASFQELEGFADAAVPELALVMRKELERTIAAGTDPYGQAWKRRKYDGGVPLTGAAKAMSVHAVGKVIVVLLDHPESRHHVGAIRGNVRRRIIPSRKQLPDPMVARMKERLSALFEEATSAGR